MAGKKKKEVSKAVACLSSGGCGGGGDMDEAALIQEAVYPTKEVLVHLGEKARQGAAVEVLCPLTGVAFVRAQVDPQDPVHVILPGGIMVQKTREEAVQLLDEVLEIDEKEQGVHEKAETDGTGRNDLLEGGIGSVVGIREYPEKNEHELFDVAGLAVMAEKGASDGTFIRRLVAATKDVPPQNVLDNEISDMESLYGLEKAEAKVQDSSATKENEAEEVSGNYISEKNEGHGETSQPSTGAADDSPFDVEGEASARGMVDPPGEVGGRLWEIREFMEGDGGQILRHELIDQGEILKCRAEESYVGDANLPLPPKVELVDDCIINERLDALEAAEAQAALDELDRKTKGVTGKGWGKGFLQSKSSAAKEKRKKKGKSVSFDLSNELSPPLAGADRERDEAKPEEEESTVFTGRIREGIAVQQPVAHTAPQRPMSKFKMNRLRERQLLQEHQGAS